MLPSGETSGGSINLPKKRRKLDCLYYSPLAFDKYGCKCKTGSSSARPETRFIHIHLARPRIGMTYLAKFLPSRQSHSINSECIYLACICCLRIGRARHSRTYERVRIHDFAHAYVRGLSRGCLLSRIFSEIFYTSQDFYALFISQ